MSENDEAKIKSNNESNGNIAYIPLTRHWTISSSSSIVLSSCSSDDEYDDNRSAPPLQWKRQKILHTDHLNLERPSSGSTESTLISQSDRNSALSVKENVAIPTEDERRAKPPRRLPPIPEDKLHRRNPQVVRQELKMFNDIIPETALSDIHLNEMPGLHDTEQWKRIAGRTVHASPPLSRSYYSTVISTLGLQEGQVPQSLGSYRRPGRSENDEAIRCVVSSPWRSPRRPVIFGSSAAVVLILVVVSVVLAVTLVRKSDQTTSNYYAGSVHVRADFMAALSDPTSITAKSFKKDFCQLVRRTLVDNKTKYAKYYSTCSVVWFRNGSIIADFILGFTRRQDTTRLTSYLNRSLVNQPLFGGVIFRIEVNNSIFDIINSYINNYNIYNYNYNTTSSIKNSTTTTYSTDTSTTTTYDYNITGVIIYDNTTTITGYYNSSVTTDTSGNKTNDNNKYKNKTSNGKIEQIVLTPLDSNEDDSTPSDKSIMNEQTSTNGPEQPTQTSYTTVTYKTLEKGLSITISETITITNNNNFENFPINNKSYELILVPTTDNIKTVVVPNSISNEKPLLPPVATLPPPVPPPPTTTTATAAAPNVEIKPSPTSYPLQPTKPISDANFAYIDESSDDHSVNSKNATSTLEDVTSQDSTTSASTTSLNTDTLTNSGSSVDNNHSLPTKPTQTTTDKYSAESIEETREEKKTVSARSNPTTVKRDKRFVLPKKHRRLLQYELLPTGKVYYVDRAFYNEIKKSKDDNESNSSAVTGSLLSRSSSVDTLNNKPGRHQHQQENRKYHLNVPSQKTQSKPSVAGGLISNNNFATTSSTFKPITTSKKKRFSSFEPTPESLDRVFDVLIAADKQRERHDFWKEKFDSRPTNARPLMPPNRMHDSTNTNTNTIPNLRTKLANVNLNSNTNKADSRSQSYTNKRNSSYDAYNQPTNCLFEDCTKRRPQIAQKHQQRLQVLNAERNYSPNTIYSTNYPKQQLPPTGKPPLPTTTATSTHQQPLRILPVSNGRVGRAPQARQTSDELSSVSEVWAARSSVDDEPHPPKKPGTHTRFQSTLNRNRPNDKNIRNDKRSASVEQQKPNRTQNKNASSTKSKFFDLFKFTR